MTQSVKFPGEGKETFLCHHACTGLRSRRIVGALLCPRRQEEAPVSLPVHYPKTLTEKEHLFYWLPGSILALAWSPDETRIVSANANGIAEVWDVSIMKNIFIYHGHTSAVHSIAWSPDGTRIASASDDRTVQVWKAQ